ncbi:MAG TPA: heparinase [Firmicutes bacterium]|nr:heparinase [Bacillota bacterium]
MLVSLWEETGLPTVPRLTARPAWQRVASAFRQALIPVAEKYSAFQWPSLPATLYMDYARTGNRAPFEAAYFKRRQVLATLVLAECLEQKGRFLDDILNGIWCISEETSWVLPAHHNQFYAQGGLHRLPRIEEPVIDLFAAETGALLAWTWHLLGSALAEITPQGTERIRWELEKRILTPYLERDDFWWMGFRNDTGHTLGNWVPWITGNCLRVFLLTEENATRRQRAVGKGLRSLDRYLQHYSPDGGCDEGPSYWGRSGGSLFECLEMLWEVSQGAFDPFSKPLLVKIGQYMRHVHIAGEYFVNFADGSAKAEVDGSLLYAYGKRIQDPKLITLGAQMYRQYGLNKLMAAPTFSLGRLIRAALLHAELMGEDGLQEDASLDHWFDRLQVMIARERGDQNQGFYLSAKGGHNGENHNHNDVGSCIVYYNGHPLLIDVGVETYTARTFSPRRYELWTMRSIYHNLPIINGYEQLPGKEHRALEARYYRDGKSSTVSFELREAYPPEAGIREWERSYRLSREPQPAVGIRDRFRLVYAHSLQLVLILPQEPRIGPDFLYLQAGAEAVKLLYDQAQWAPSWELIPIADPLLAACWGRRIFRLCLTRIEPDLEGEVILTLRQ